MEFSSQFKRSAFQSLMKQGYIFRMKGELPFESDVYHVFVVLNYNPSTNDILLLTNGTSRVEKRLEYLRKTHVDADATTVILEAGSYSFITKRTLFDCNSVSEINLGDIPFADDDVRFIGNELSEEDVRRLVAAALASENVLPDYKRLIGGDSQ